MSLVVLALVLLLGAVFAPELYQWAGPALVAPPPVKDCTRYIRHSGGMVEPVPVPDTLCFEE